MSRPRKAAPLGLLANPSGHPAHEDWVATVEAERERLAGLLEDRVIPPLNLLLSQTKVYEQTLSSQPPVGLAMSVLLGLVAQTLQQVRELQTGLHSTVLQMLGLEPALEALAGQIGRTYGMHVTLSLERLRERLPPQIELALYRFAQDALDRAIRWAHASQITICLALRNGQLVFSVSDNGRVTPEGAQIGSNALDFARQRVEHLGGTVEVGTCPGSGSELRISLILGAPDELTPREIEIVRLLVEGLRNKEIASRLSITPRTVSFHLNSIYSKLGVSSRTEAVIRALRQGRILQPGKMDR